MELNVTCSNNPNPGFGHGFEFWRKSPDNNCALGTCKFCNKEIAYPMTKSISDMIEKQEIAATFVDKFFKMSLEDNNIIFYLVEILNNFINFIDNNRKELLYNKMYQLISFSVLVGTENEELIRDIVLSLKEGNVDVFMDKLEIFEKFNSDLILNSMEEKMVYSK